MYGQSLVWIIRWKEILCQFHRNMYDNLKVIYEHYKKKYSLIGYIIHFAIKVINNINIKSHF